MARSERSLGVREPDEGDDSPLASLNRTLASIEARLSRLPNAGSRSAPAETAGEPQPLRGPLRRAAR